MSNTRESHFEHYLLELGIKDEDCHHEFTTGLHGEKLDFDVVTRGTREWDMWVELSAAETRQIFPGPDAPCLVSIANGTIDITEAIADELNAHGNYETPVLVAHTEKFVIDEQKIVQLSEAAKKLIAFYGIDQVVEIDDAATTGSTTAMPIPKLRELGVNDIRVLYAWLRNPHLPYLDAQKIQYYGLINEHYLPNYTAEDCQDHGFCAEDPPRPLIPYVGNSKPKVV